MRRRRRLALLALAAFAVSGCGGGGSETPTQVIGVLTCQGDPLARNPPLPSGFPEPSELTYVESKTQGPTLVVNGFYSGALKDAYRFYRDGFEQAGYTILFEEQERSDAEVSYRDAGGKTSGQVALRGQCTNGNVSVRITNRPA